MNVPRETTLNAIAKLDEARALDEVLTRFVADIQTLMSAGMITNKDAVSLIMVEITMSLQDRTKILTDIASSLQAEMEE
jgi:hypothetical protein